MTKRNRPRGWLTLRKVRNRGHQPLRYQLPDTAWCEANKRLAGGIPERAKGCGYVHGWVYRETSTYVWFFAINLGRLKLPATERRYMRALN